MNESSNQSMIIVLVKKFALSVMMWFVRVVLCRTRYLCTGTCDLYESVFSSYWVRSRRGAVSE